ncbi:hypothetical protein [Endozoicomonas sp. SCSIO W0465]|uniref:hypothetical protein n=1 Tax=Endozoicomonas sp. SCSIO W0465 TaxID=2918516 RepID=UPI0020765328|nr:hypothetical protein [Endozoicomonas sp. SCSIO W0465]USE35598.1 hypothetical protein MJO57_26495 [Endozoicomonas sp. SCSIO W0465]
MIYSKRKQFMYWYVPAATRVSLESNYRVVYCFSELRRKVKGALKRKKKYLIFKEINGFSTSIVERAIHPSAQS